MWLNKIGLVLPKQSFLCSYCDPFALLNRKMENNSSKKKTGIALNKIMGYFYKYLLMCKMIQVLKGHTAV